MTSYEQLEVQRLTNEIDRAITQIEKVSRQVDQLRDVQRAAQYLVDILDHQLNQNGPQTLGGPFGEAYANLRAALRAYYQPNGGHQ